MQELYSQSTAGVQSQSTSKVLRNTYALLAMTLTTSALAAGAAMAVGIGFGLAIVFNLVAIGLLWFVLPRTANSSAGIGVVFAFTTLLGAGLAPTLTYYVAQSGGQIVFQALAGTAIIFFALSGYVLTTGKDFSFLGGFLFIGLLVVVLAMLGFIVAGTFFGVDITAAQLAISAAIVFIMSGLILFHTSQIIHGGETNYIMATASLYLVILNLFTSLLHLLGAADD